MKKLHFAAAFFSLFLCLSTVSAQSLKNKIYEAGLISGFSNYAGDLSGKYLFLKESRFGYGAFLRCHLGRDFNLKVHFLNTFITGDDKNFPKLSPRKFKFSTNISEIALTGEYQLLDFSVIFPSKTFLASVSAYAFGGGGIALVRPSATCYGSRDECDKNTVVNFPEPNLPHQLATVPLGFGLRYFDDWRAVWGLELGLRTVFSDLLDGVSLNASADGNDYYLFAGMSAGFLLNTPRPQKKRGR